MERLPILIDSPKKLDHQLSSDPDKTPVSNAANSDSEPEDMTQPGEKKRIRQKIVCVSLCVCVAPCCCKKQRVHQPFSETFICAIEKVDGMTDIHS